VIELKADLQAAFLESRMKSLSASRRRIGRLADASKNAARLK
jgi:hypothetical protein